MYNPSPILGRLAYQVFVFNSLVTKLTGRDHEQRIAAQLPGVSGLQFGVMRILSEGPFTLSEIAQKMMLAPATLVPVVDRLEEGKILVRGRDAHDRRRNPLSLTDLGREMLARTSIFDGQDVMTSALQKLGAAKAQQLNDLLVELLQQLAPDVDYVGQVFERLNRQQPKE